MLNSKSAESLFKGGEMTDNEKPKRDYLKRWLVIFTLISVLYWIFSCIFMFLLSLEIRWDYLLQHTPFVLLPLTETLSIGALVYSWRYRNIGKKSNTAISLLISLGLLIINIISILIYWMG